MDSDTSGFLHFPAKALVIMIFFRFSLCVWSESLQFARVLRNGSSVRDYGNFVYFF